MSEKYPLSNEYFIRFAKRIIVKTGLPGLIVGGYALWPAVTQYFHELTQAIQRGTVGATEAVPLLCCVGPAVLGFGLLYKGIRNIRGSPSYDR